MLGVDGGEGVALEFVFLTVDNYCALVVVDVVEEQSTVHLPSGIALYDGRLLLKLKYGDGFVHECGESARLLVDAGRVGRGYLGLEFLAGVVAIGLHSKCGKRHKVDAVALLKCSEVGVA